MALPSQSDGFAQSFQPLGHSHSATPTSSSSPVEPVTTTSSMRSAFVPSNGLGSVRIGAGSPSHELGSRLFSKRAREIQAEEGVVPNPWGPPTSGHSTPLRENIPESPTDDFPTLSVLSTDLGMPSVRRARAGTVPSRFSPAGLPNGISSAIGPITSRPTPSTSPFKGVESLNVPEPEELPPNPATTSSLLSRLRSGSLNLPQRTTNYVGASSPFGPTLFSSSWANGRDRTSTVASGGSNGPISPTQSALSRDGVGEQEMRTLDYLGLADTPQQQRATIARPSMQTVVEGQRTALPPFLSDVGGLGRSNRYRSYSVNAKERYGEEEDLENSVHAYPSHNGSMTPSAASTAAAMAATQAQIHQHNLAVQAFANHSTVTRPRARTAGVLEAPPPRTMKSYLATPSRLENSILAADLGLDGFSYDDLSEAVKALQLNRQGDISMLAPEDGSFEGPTRALWLGSIPASTTISSLIAIFQPYGAIESARVLTHKNCGFVNFERIESAIQARSVFNGKEIFPGAGPVRIGFAKAPTSPAAGTPGHNGVFPSPSPDPFGSGNADSGISMSGSDNNPAVVGEAPKLDSPKSSAVVLPGLRDMKTDMIHIVSEFGASEEDQLRVGKSIDSAIKWDRYETEIPSIPEPSHNRIHDAPKLRDVRKRIDNNSCSQAEIEEIAMQMLPEVAELASDYLGNTVVQKLFEFCSEGIKESMLEQIAPTLAEVGVHKNGTWAAQKIIDVAKTPTQMSTIVDNVRPYTVPLFLDQYGNYVLQCCLRFGSPWNDFIFETMLTRMWEISQGRFGARAMRACLESHHASKDQQRMLAAAIALHSVQLATNANGALLLTWFLDTCTFPQRRTVLAPRLVPHLVHLCTHKVAYLTVLKVINQRTEPDARDIILRALFFSPGDKVLEDILCDHACGATLIFKVLTTPFFDEALRSDVVSNVRTVLLRIKAQPGQGYKRLMDEVGLSTRGNGKDSHSHSRGRGGDRSTSTERRTSSSHQRTPNHHRENHHQQNLERQYSNPYYSSPSHQSSDASRGMGMDTQFPMFGSLSQQQQQQQQQQQMQYQAVLASRQMNQNFYGTGFGSPDLYSQSMQSGGSNHGPIGSGFNGMSSANNIGGQYPYMNGMGLGMSGMNMPPGLGQGMSLGSLGMMGMGQSNNMMWPSMQGSQQSQNQSQHQNQHLHMHQQPLGLGLGLGSGGQSPGNGNANSNSFHGQNSNNNNNNRRGIGLRGMGTGVGA